MDREQMFDILNNPRELKVDEIREFYDAIGGYNQDWCNAYNSLTPDMPDYADRIAELNKESMERNEKLDILNSATPVRSFIKAFKSRSHLQEIVWDVVKIGIIPIMQ